MTTRCVGDRVQAEKALAYHALVIAWPERDEAPRASDISSLPPAIPFHGCFHGVPGHEPTQDVLNGNSSTTNHGFTAV